MPSHVWIIDDESAICWSLKKALEQAGYACRTFSNAEDAIHELKPVGPLDAVLLDMRMPGMDGLEATRHIKRIKPKVPIIMMTAFGDLGSAIQAIELDVFEYLTKPFDLSDAMKAIDKAIGNAATKASGNHVSQPSVDQHFDTLLGNSAAMQMVYKQIAVAAKSETSVLICGPSGVGKESVASAIHRHSLRCRCPFLAFSAQSIAPIALSMELLGSEASPNYSQQRSGALALASDGVLFIDEVSDLSISMQAQLLQVLEKKTYLPLAGTAHRRCEARIIASTSRDLSELVADREFLPELLQRLSVFAIELKPLSQRREDIVPIARAYLASRDHGREKRFTERSETWLKEQPWIGNLRQLQTAIEHAVVVSKSSMIDVEDLQVTSHQGLEVEAFQSELADWIRKWVDRHLRALDEKGQRVTSAGDDDVLGVMYDDFLATVEPPMLEAMMRAFESNRAVIAAQLGLHRSTLRQKMRRYKIE
jgi:two-component system, NtrC family, nitrogen regulation response regulator GlnG